jgi:uncharacterized membrane protein
MSPAEIESGDGPPLFPAHIEDTISAIAKLHADHERLATPMERLVERLTSLFAQSWFVATLTLIVALWVAVNWLLYALRRVIIDPPPFYWLQGALTLGAVYMTSLILTTQRRADGLGIQRERLTLELAILAEQKNAKIIELLEELRRDHPQIPDRSDPIAEQMSTPADPGAVLEAIKETHESLMAEMGGALPGETDTPGV